MTNSVSDTISSTQTELEKLVADLRGLLSSKDLDSVPEIKVLRQRLDDGMHNVRDAAVHAAQEAARQYSIAFNQATDGVLQSFAGVPGHEVLRSDAFGLLDDVVRNPAANGFTDIGTPCLQGLYLAPAPRAQR